MAQQTQMAIPIEASHDDADPTRPISRERLVVLGLQRAAGPQYRRMPLRGLQPERCAHRVWLVSDCFWRHATLAPRCAKYFPAIAAWRWSHGLRS